MTWPAPATLLRHQPPALRLDAIVSRDDLTLQCRGDAPTWTWPSLLEGCAQTAGLCAGMRADGPTERLDDRALIAEYRDVKLHRPTHSGAVLFSARFDRRVLRFWRYAVEAHTQSGDLLLEGLVTLAPAPTPD